MIPYSREAADYDSPGRSVAQPWVRGIYYPLSRRAARNNSREAARHDSREAADYDSPGRSAAQPWVRGFDYPLSPERARQSRHVQSHT